MILMMAKHGNHRLKQKFVSDADVKRFFQLNHHYWDDLVQLCRKPNEPIPFVENLTGSTWRVNSKGSGRVAIVTGAATDNEREITSVSGPGQLAAPTYWALFENAITNLNRCMQGTAFSDFLSCVTNGIASIDAYISYRAYLHNTNQPSEPLIDDKQNKVSQDDKIDQWIPKMLNGKRLDKSGSKWQNFK